MYIILKRFFFLIEHDRNTKVYHLKNFYELLEWKKPTTFYDKNERTGR